MPEFMSRYLAQEYIDNPSLLTLERYDHFRTQRLDRIFVICHRVINRSMPATSTRSALWLPGTAEPRHEPSAPTGPAARERLQSTTVQYYRCTGPEKHLCSFDFVYTPVPPLPSGDSGESIFRRAIAECQEHTRRLVLTDLYRWLVFSNFAKFGGSRSKGTRERTLQELDAVYPYGGVLMEATNAQASYHPFGNTQGAVLYLLMQSLRQAQNREDVNYLLGVILLSVLNHKHFKKSGCPTIDLLRNTVLS
jgi:hypothetical protein